LKDNTKILRYNGVSMIKLTFRTESILEESGKIGKREFYEKLFELFFNSVRERIYPRLCSEFDESTDEKKRFRFDPLCIDLNCKVFCGQGILSVAVNTESKRRGTESSFRTLCQNWDENGRILFFCDIFKKIRGIRGKEDNFFFDGSDVRIYPQGVYGMEKRKNIPIISQTRISFK